MEPPFVYGRIATDPNFADRELETRHLVDNFKDLVNTVIISPKRWGKSSLVNKAAETVKSEQPGYRFCFMDLFNVKTEEQFYTLLAQSVLRATASKWDEAVESAKKFFSRLVPKISVGADPRNEISLDFDWTELKRNPDEILDIAERVAKEKDIKLVVCIDEFQNIAEFDDPLNFQRRLRAHWQHQQNVAYCLYGSKRHIMMDVFTDASKPFYEFGDIFFLNKIDSAHLQSFIKERFEATGKKIDDEAAGRIVLLADNHPYYTQQIAQNSWLRTQKVCTEGIVNEAHSSLVRQFGLLFSNLMESLSFQQTCYLEGLVNGEKSISSAETMHKYRISSATAASRSQKSLIQKDILDNSGGTLAFQDPIFAYWLKTEFFGKR